MSAVDRARLDERLERIERACRRLEEVAGRPLDEFLADEDMQALTERHLEVAIQAAIDVGSHLIAVHGWATPTQYRDVFEELGRRSVIDEDLSLGLQSAAGLRNILVHDYLDVDPERIFGGLKTDLDDLRAFGAAIYRWLAERSKTQPPR